MSASKKQTAIEWLLEKISLSKLDNRTYLMPTISNEEIEQAKAMEKEQIMMAVKDSWYMAKGSNFQDPQEEQYYNQTYETI